MEKILSIKEVDDFKLEPKGRYTYEGYFVETSEQVIKIGVDNKPYCCEDFGYLSTNDDIQEFVGANLLGIKLTDTNLSTKKIEEIEYVEEGGVMFVDFETDRGVLQLAVYNSHNGYYGHGHSVVLQSEQLTHEDTL